jgi:hypothetical protein
MVPYLDMCCLKRPFDDQAPPRIRIETVLGAAKRLGPAVKVRVGELTAVAREVL